MMRLSLFFSVFICLSIAKAQVYKTSAGGFSNLQGYPTFVATNISAKIDLLPDNVYNVAAVQFIPVSVHKVFAVQFEYETCDDDGGPIWNSADGVALIVGKAASSYSSLTSLPVGDSLGVVSDGLGLAVQIKTYGWNKGIHIIDGQGTLLKRVWDSKTYTNCQKVPVNISINAQRKLTIKKGSGSGLVTLDYQLSQTLFDSLENKQLAFSAATGSADSAHKIEILALSGVVNSGGGGGRNGAFGQPNLTSNLGVCFYKDSNYQGEKACFDFNSQDSRANENEYAGAFNDQISSIQIVGDIEIRICEDSAFFGRCDSLSASVPQLSAALDDTMSSFQMDIARNYSQFTISVLSGDRQSGLSYSVFSSPLVVKVLDSSQQPVANTYVRFEASQRDWVRGLTSYPSQVYEAKTNGQGQAEVYWIPNKQAIGPVTMSAFVYNRIAQTTHRSIQMQASVTGVPVMTTVPAGTCRNEFNDPLFKYQWHLDNVGQKNFSSVTGDQQTDINACRSYSQNIKGSGVIVGIIDTGAELNHEDLSDRFVLNGSYNFLTNSHDPTNTFATVGDHGTSVSGITLATGGNGKGGVGVAPKALLKAFNPLESSDPTGNIIESLGAHSLAQDVDVFNMSFGLAISKSIALTVQSLVVNQRIKTSVQNLRSGKGSVFVHALGNAFADLINTASGNLGSDTEPLDVCQSARALQVSCHIPSNDPDGFYPWAIGVGAVNSQGKRSAYSSAGSNIWVSAPSGGGGWDNQALPSVLQGPLTADRVLAGILTTDQSSCQKGYSTYQSRSTNYFNSDALGLNPDCRYLSNFGGTSAAAPVVTGSVALILEANPLLTWRDVKYILANTTTQVDSSISVKSKALSDRNYVYRLGWETNGANFRFHNWYGFGLVDVGAAVTMAKNYASPLGTDFNYSPSWMTGQVTSSAIQNNSYSGRGTGTALVDTTNNKKIESTQIQLYITHPFPGDLSVELVSPSGTKSILMNLGNGANGYDDLGNSNESLTLTTNAFYMEDSQGQWTLNVIDGVSHSEAGDGNSNGTLVSWGVRFFGARAAVSTFKTGEK